MMNETKIKQSFGLVKNDIGNIYEHLRFLYVEVNKLKSENSILAERIAELGNKKRTKRAKKKTAKKSVKK